MPGRVGWGREGAKLVRRSYFYRFAYVPEALGEKVPGATHSSEILFVFDAVAASLKERASGAYVAVGKTMRLGSF
jgi:carboxylesterase type B